METSEWLCRPRSALLAVNHTEIVFSQDELYEAMIRLTISEWSKEDFARFLRSHARVLDR